MGDLGPIFSSTLLAHFPSSGQPRITNDTKPWMWQISFGSKVSFSQKAISNFVSEVRLPIHCGRHFKFRQNCRLRYCRVVTCSKNSGKYSNLHISKSTREERFSKFFQGTTSNSSPLIRSLPFIESPIINDVRGACHDIKICMGHPRMSNAERQGNLNSSKVEKMLMKEQNHRCQCT